jgi:transcriptional regulator with XRE-family HTH domain
MIGTDLQSGREQNGWTQEESARRLGVSQPYLSLLEKGLRRVPEKLARKAAKVYGLSAATLPVESDLETLELKNEDTLASDLAALGYPGFSHLPHGRKKNPAEVLLSALSARELNSRLVEALPWVLFEYPDLNWSSLVSAAKVRDLQNRLGFVTSLARRVAEKRGESEKANKLRRHESALEPSRLFREDTLCHESLTPVERKWLDTTRPREAEFWRLWTDLKPEHLSYA